MTNYTIAGEDSTPRFIRRMRNMRALGMGLAGICVAAALRDLAAAPWLWVLLGLLAIAWPHVARERALRAPDPVRAEFSNLEIDAAIGAFWVAAIGFNLLPSVLLLSMLWIGQVAAAGLKFWLRCLAIQALVAALAFVALGFRFSPATDMIVVVACVPFLLVYPIAMSALLHELAGKVRRQKRLLERLVCTDGLTGLANRQHWQWQAEQQLAGVARGECCAAMLMIDVDDFKGVNDRYGHILGDEVLTTIAHALQDSVRAGDVAGRYAGDEFALVMPGANEATAGVVAERFRCAVSSLRFPGAPSLRCTVSIGLVVIDGPGPDVAHWISRADEAMYRSKRAGRDRVSVYKAVAAETSASILPLPRRAR